MTIEKNNIVKAVAGTVAAVGVTGWAVAKVVGGVTAVGAGTALVAPVAGIAAVAAAAVGLKVLFRGKKGG